MCRNEGELEVGLTQYGERTRSYGTIVLSKIDGVVDIQTGPGPATVDSS